MLRVKVGLVVKGNYTQLPHFFWSDQYAVYLKEHTLHVNNLISLKYHKINRNGTSHVNNRKIL